MNARTAAFACVTAVSVAIAAPAAQQKPLVFRAGTAGVAVDVSVTDGRKAVLELTAADFELYDNGVRQEITNAGVEAIPFDLHLVVDTSASLTGPMFEQFKRDVATIGGMLRPQDRLRLVTFSTRGLDVFGWREGNTALPLTRIATAGATAFYQALAAVLVREADAGRRQLIVAMSDGYDNVSFLDAPDVRDLARQANAVLHVVLRKQTGAPARSKGWVPYSGAGNINALRDAAEATGGRLRSVDPNESLTAAFKTALDEFRTGYVLWYTPIGVDRPGWHTINVKLKQPQKYAVRARNGYDAGGKRP